MILIQCYGSMGVYISTLVKRISFQFRKTSNHREWGALRVCSAELAHDSTTTVHKLCHHQAHCPLLSRPHQGPVALALGSSWTARQHLEQHRSNLEGLEQGVQGLASQLCWHRKLMHPSQRYSKLRILLSAYAYCQI